MPKREIKLPFLPAGGINAGAVWSQEASLNILKNSLTLTTEIKAAEAGFKHLVWSLNFLEQFYWDSNRSQIFGADVTLK